MDAITLLKNDHKTVSKLFKRFEAAGENAHAEKRSIVDRIVEELAVHAAIEELVFYPAVRAEVDDAEDMTLEALEEHHLVKWTLSELETMDPTHERFDAKVTVLIENVRHHVEEEESDLFPKVREAMKRKQLDELGEALASAKETAPTHPHPRMPDSPPGNLLNPVIGAAENVASSMKSLAKDAVDFVNPLSDHGSKESGNGSSKPSKRSSSAARTVEERASRARSTAEKTARKAKKQAKSATKTVGRSASSTKRVAKKANVAASKAKGTAKRTVRKSSRAASKATGTAKRTARKSSRAASKASGTAKRTTRQSSTGAKKSAGAARGARSTATKRTRKQSTKR